LESPHRGGDGVYCAQKLRVGFSQKKKKKKNSKEKEKEGGKNSRTKRAWSV